MGSDWEENSALALFVLTGPIFPQDTQRNISLSLTYMLSNRYLVGSREDL